MYILWRFSRSSYVIIRYMWICVYMWKTDVFSFVVVYIFSIFFCGPVKRGGLSLSHYYIRFYIQHTRCTVFGLLLITLFIFIIFVIVIYDIFFSNTTCPDIIKSGYWNLRTIIKEEEKYNNKNGNNNKKK